MDKGINQQKKGSNNKILLDLDNLMSQLLVAIIFFDFKNL